MKKIETTLCTLMCILALSSTNAQSWCTPSLSTPNTAGITNVSFNTIDRTSAFDEGYVLTLDTTSVDQGASYTLSVTMSGGVAPAVWIDWNQDGDFDDTGEDVVPPASTWYPTFSSTQTMSITVPATAVLGTTRMRVYGKAFDGSGPVTDPCSTTDPGGDVEDFHIEVLDPNLINVTPTLLNFTAPMGSNTFDVETAVTWSLSISAPWISTDITTAPGNATVTVSVTENTSTTPRSGYIIVANTSNEDTVFVEQEGASTTSIHELENAFSVFNNSDQLVIEPSFKSAYQFFLYDAFGKIISKGTKSGRTELNIQHLHPGIYFVKLEVNGSMLSKTIRK